MANKRLAVVALLLVLHSIQSFWGYGRSFGRGCLLVVSNTFDKLQNDKMEIKTNGSARRLQARRRTRIKKLKARSSADEKCLRTRRRQVIWYYTLDTRHFSRTHLTTIATAAAGSRELNPVPSQEERRRRCHCHLYASSIYCPLFFTFT